MTTAPLSRWLSALLLLMAANLAVAQDYEAGKQAYLAKDYDKALEILEPLAEAGNSDAQVTLGLMYDYGHGVERNPAKAIEWYTKAAKQGLPVVQHDLGVKYFQGKGIAQDYQQAARWWEQAANAGLADSQFNLGLMYYRGLGIDQDYTRALDLFQRAAGQGHANAQYSLAVMYAFGQGVDKNYEKALELFRAAADKGIGQAQYNLGVFYENGYGVEKNIAEARKWYEQAAEKDIAKAAERLSLLQDDTETASPDEKQTARLSTGTAKKTDVTQTASAPKLRGRDWISQQPADAYTLQLISLTDEQGVRNYLLNNDLADQGGYIAVTIDDTRRYNAFYGRYDDYKKAQAAIKSLPANVQRGKPWVRNFGILQKIMQ